MENELTIVNSLISFIDNIEEHVIHSKCDNIEIMINDEADKFIKKTYWFTEK